MELICLLSPLCFCGQNLLNKCHICSEVCTMILYICKKKYILLTYGSGDDKRFVVIISTPQTESIMGGAVVDDGPPGVKAPDGGWGWAVLAGCFVITGFSYAFPKAVSVFFKELIREFGVGYSDTAWISSILLAMLYGTGNTHKKELNI